MILVAQVVSDKLMWIDYYVIIYTVGIGVSISVLLTAVITAVITSCIMYLIMRKRTVQTKGQHNPVPIYDVPSTEVKQDIIELQSNTAYGHVNRNM